MVYCTKFKLWSTVDKLSRIWPLPISNLLPLYHPNFNNLGFYLYTNTQLFHRLTHVLGAIFLSRMPISCSRSGLSTFLMPSLNFQPLLSQVGLIKVFFLRHNPYTNLESHITIVYPFLSIKTFNGRDPVLRTRSTLHSF